MIQGSGKGKHEVASSNQAQGIRRFSGFTAGDQSFFAASMKSFVASDAVRSASSKSCRFLPFAWNRTFITGFLAHVRPMALHLDRDLPSPSTRGPRHNLQDRQRHYFLRHLKKGRVRLGVVFAPPRTPWTPPPEARTTRAQKRKDAKTLIEPKFSKTGLHRVRSVF